MPPKDNSKTKKLILLGLAVFTIIIVIATLFLSDSNKNNPSKTNQYQLENSIFSYKLPVDFEPTSSTRESVTVRYTGGDETLKGSEITIGRYLKKDLSNETSAKLKEIILSSADGKIQTEKTVTESKTASSKPLLTVADTTTPNKTVKYLIGTSYIWRIQIETKTDSEQATVGLQKITDLIAESIVEK